MSQPTLEILLNEQAELKVYAHTPIVGVKETTAGGFYHKPFAALCCIVRSLASRNLHCKGKESGSCSCPHVCIYEQL